MNNLLVISLDTVRADVAYSGQFPGINFLRDHGITFENAISSAPLTPVSHASFFTGKHPFNHGIRHLFKEKLDNNVITLAQYLKSKKYKTHAIVSCPGLNRWYQLDRGFDTYDDEIPKLPDGSDPLLSVDVKVRGTALKRAHIVYDRASNWIKQNHQSSFFLFVHFFDAHWPYVAPSIHSGSNPYEHEVGYSDFYLYKLLEDIKQLGLWDTTNIILFSDHGEDLEGLYPNDKGGEKLGHPEEAGHGCLLYDQTQKVPLIIRFANLNISKQTIFAQVSLIDVLPTILEYLEIKFKKEAVDGKSFLSIIKFPNDAHTSVSYFETLYPHEQNLSTNNRFPLAQNKIGYRINNKYKVIFHHNSNRCEIYDLASDPNEKNNLAP